MAFYILMHEHHHGSAVEVFESDLTMAELPSLQVLAEYFGFEYEPEKEHMFIDRVEKISKLSAGDAMRMKFRESFPWLDTDEPVSGADVVDAVVEFWEKLKTTSNEAA